jgi:hypothetical protein
MNNPLRVPSYLRHPGFEQRSSLGGCPKTFRTYRHPDHPDLCKNDYLNDCEGDGEDGEGEKGLKTFINGYKWLLNDYN